MAILSNFLIQFFVVLGLIVLFSFILYLLNVYFYERAGRFGYVMQYVTGVIGTPIHELSHALVAIMFGHKVDEMKLFTMDDDGCLGYVVHSYNPSNFYHRIGNFFIGVAPIFGGALAIYLIILFGLPNINNEIVEAYKILDSITYDISSVDFYLNVLELCWKTFIALFNFNYITDWKWWLFIVLILFIAKHMMISKADMEGSIGGLIFLAAFFLIANIILWLFSANAILTTFVIKALCYIIPILFISLAIRLVECLVVTIVNIFR